LPKLSISRSWALEILPLDVIDDASIKQAVESVTAITGGKLDFLVNNSRGGVGSYECLRILKLTRPIGHSQPLLDTDVSAAKMFDVNVFAVITVTQAFAPLLI
jgi:1-acylglycerone phosphate reductase